ncbi:hypothetical protein KUL118_17730 [Tenacibaculum sp. KUL118]|nr:hypothetical protein KUL118_17730 [Tenacibaculum sp. KUL118]
MRLLITILFLSAVAGCSKRNDITDSQIRYTTAINEHNSIVSKANNYLDKNLVGDLPLDIAHLIYAKELVHHAEKVLEHAKITGVKSEKLKALTSRLSQYDKDAQVLAIELLNASFKKTLEFKQTVNDMPLAPVGGASLHSKSMIDYLGEEYNNSLDKCCLTPLKDIEILLRGVNDETAWAIKKKIVNVENQLSHVLTNSEYQKDYAIQLMALNDALAVN